MYLVIIFLLVNYHVKIQFIVNFEYPSHSLQQGLQSI